ncbi:MAG TPA: hypothetical protein VM097_12090 [Mycobacteriales bacterium]|nr:hypothetical protein [Mycobacteriales bacterium]
MAFTILTEALVRHRHVARGCTGVIPKGALWSTRPERVGGRGWRTDILGAIESVVPFVRKATVVRPDALPGPYALFLFICALAICVSTISTKGLEPTAKSQLIPFLQQPPVYVICGDRALIEATLKASAVEPDAVWSGWKVLGMDQAKCVTKPLVFKEFAFVWLGNGELGQAALIARNGIASVVTGDNDAILDDLAGLVAVSPKMRTGLGTIYVLHHPGGSCTLAGHQDNDPDSLYVPPDSVSELAMSVTAGQGIPMPRGSVNNGDGFRTWYVWVWKADPSRHNGVDSRSALAIRYDPPKGDEPGTARLGAHTVRDTDPSPDRRADAGRRCRRRELRAASPAPDSPASTDDPWLEHGSTHGIADLLANDLRAAYLRVADSPSAPLSRPVPVSTRPERGPSFRWLSWRRKAIMS